MKTFKKIPKNVIDRINLINSLIPQIDQLDELVYTYAGGTWPYIIDLKEIRVKNQFVKFFTKNEDRAGYLLDKNKRYNTNGTKWGEDLDQLKNDLSIILKAYKKALNN